MSTRYEYYDAGATAVWSAYGILISAQTFTPSVSHTITSVKIKAFRVGSPGTVTASIRATDGDGKPTGIDLCSGTIDGNGFTTDTDGVLYEITLGAGISLAASTKYAILVKAPSGDADNRVSGIGSGGNPYAGGQMCGSVDNGVNWTIYADYDKNFEDWGTATQIVAPATIASGQAFGIPTVAPGPVIVSPSSIASVQAFGTPTVALVPLHIFPSTIASSQAFGIPNLKYNQVISPPTISSAVTFGTPTVAPGPVTVYPTTIASAEAFGVPFVCQYQGVTSYAVAACSYGSSVYLFRIGLDGHLYRRESADNGVSWGSWVDMGDISGDATTRLACCFKDADEAIVIYSTQDVDLESKMVHYTINQYYDYLPIFGTHFGAQTFTTGPAFELTKIRLKLSRVGKPGTLTVAIRATDGSGHPTGADLTTGTLDGDTCTIDPAGAWYEFNVTDYSLAAATKYAIILRKSGGSSNNNVLWKIGPYPSSFAGGNMEFSSDSATSWSTYVNSDRLFEAWGYYEARLYRRRLSGGTWEAAANWTNDLRCIYGLAVYHMGDWNVAVCGQDMDDQPGVWTCILGDGYSGAPGTWYSLSPLIIRDCSEDYSYSFPSIDMPDVFRLFFIETHAGEEAYSMPFFSYMVPGAEYISALWREPVPFNVSSAYGLNMAHAGGSVYLSCPSGYWSSVLTPASVDLTGDITGAHLSIKPYAGSFDLALRNDDGRYNTLALSRGCDVRLRFGYYSTEGQETAGYLPFASIDSIERTLKKGHSQAIIHALDGWSLLQNWTARYEHAWSLDEKNVFQLLSFIFARAGIELSSYSTSDRLTSFKPAFTIRPGERGLSAVKRLLALVEDVILFVSDTAYLIHPKSTDSADYAYGIAHKVSECTMFEISTSVNISLTQTADIDVGDYRWGEINILYDRLSKEFDENIATVADAHKFGEAILRDAELNKVSGLIIVPMNCGHDLYDVIDLTIPHLDIASTLYRILTIDYYWLPDKGTYQQRLLLCAV